MANPLEGRLRDGAGIVFGGGSVGDGGGNGKAAAVANARAGAKVAWSTSILPPQPLPGNLIAGEGGAWLTAVCMRGAADYIRINHII